VLWTNRISGTTNALRAISVGATNLVVVGHRGTILQSPMIPPPQLKNTHWAGNNSTFSFVSFSGATYTIEYKDALAAPSWTFLQSVLGTGGILSISDTNAFGRSRVYRARAE
jgi:hypothetical protein